MNYKKVISMIVVFGVLLAGCQSGQGGGTKSVEPTNAPTVIVVTNTPEAAATSTAVDLPTATPQVATTSAPVVTLPDYSSSAYVDDHSTPAGLVISYANAINRHEYIRAYSYWSNPGKTFGTLDAFTTSYETTDHVTVLLGEVSSEGAAGSVYSTIPVVLTESLTDGSTKRMANCYVLRFLQPGNFGEPPFDPMFFDQYSPSVVDAGTSDADALASACSTTDLTQGLNAEAPGFASVSDISSSNYLDNRSGAVEVVSSLLNALNRKEYVRAYSYWQDTKPVGSYDSYAAGFKDTDTVTAVFGTVNVDAGAGQYYYTVPLGMVVKTTINTTQTFIGCYTLHLSNPGMQGTLPFQPLGITKGTFKQVTNGTDLSPLLASACK
ncbi:MAG: hypothetical protein VB013_10815 [Anaerolineaceae bacterium]|nr:hypothetical protein [Anaerolineaceae bacterium]